MRQKVFFKFLFQNFELMDFQAVYIVLRRPDKTFGTVRQLREQRFSEKQIQSKIRLASFKNGTLLT